MRKRNIRRSRALARQHPDSSQSAWGEHHETKLRRDDLARPARHRPGRAACRADRGRRPAVLDRRRGQPCERRAQPGRENDRVRPRLEVQARHHREHHRPDRALRQLLESARRGGRIRRLDLALADAPARLEHRADPPASSNSNATGSSRAASAGTARPSRCRRRSRGRRSRSTSTGSTSTRTCT